MTRNLRVNRIYAVLGSDTGESRQQLLLDSSRGWAEIGDVPIIESPTRCRFVPIEDLQG